MSMTTVESLVYQIRNGEDPDGHLMLALLAQIEGITVIVARPYRQYIELGELLSLSFLAASEAVREWDPERAGFITIYRYRLLAELSAAAATEGTSVYIPSHMRSRIRQYRQFVQQYQAVHGGREPDDDCICRSLRFTDRDLQAVKQASMAMRTDSLDRPLTDDGDETMLTLGDTIPAAADEAEDITDRLYRQELAECLRETLRDLPDEELMVVRLRFGKALTVEQTASQMGLEAKTVRKLSDKALRRLRDRRNGLSGFLRERTLTQHVGFDSWAHNGASSPEMLILKYEQHDYGKWH